MRISSDLALYRRVLREARGFRVRIAVIFLLSLLATPLALLTPLPLMIVVDSVLGDRPAPGLLRAVLPDAFLSSDTGLLAVCALMLVMIVLLAELRALATWLLQAFTGEGVLLAIRSRLFGHVQRLSLSYHDSNASSDSAYRIQYDTPSIEYLAAYGVLPFATAAVTVAAMVVVTARIDWQLAMVALLVAPVLFGLLRACRARIREEWRNAKELEGSAYSVVQEALTALRVVKAFGQEEREGERFHEWSRAGMKARIRATVVEATFGMLVGLVTALGTASVLYIGARHVQTGVLTLGELLLVMGYLTQLYQPLTTMSRQAATLQSHLASAERVYRLFEEESEVGDEGARLPIARARGTVEFRSVDFSYGSERPVLRDLSFSVGPGTCLGIEGVTGAGKTTIINLLTRFYDPTGGEVLLDGRDLREYRLRDLRDQFAIVLQEPVLFSASIAENIAYGRPGAHHDEIERAARLANADEFIGRLPQGYDTQAGERGVQLSGGQRQRVALARAFLKDAPIVILDEPTSSVDAGTERAIVQAVEDLIKGRTAFLISHRETTLAASHGRIRIEDGRAGPHAVDSLIEEPSRWRSEEHAGAFDRGTS